METPKTEWIAGKMIDRVKTFEDAWQWADEETRNEFLGDVCKSPDAIAYTKLRLIIRVVNLYDKTGKRFIPDYKNPNQKKWFPVFNLSSGCGFGHSSYFSDYTHAGVGSRLCFSSEEKSDYVARQFSDLYNQYFNQ